MEIRNTAGAKDLRAAARLNVFNMQDKLERGQFTPTQIAYYMYSLSESAAELCETLLADPTTATIVQEMIRSPYGSAEVPGPVPPADQKPRRVRRTKQPPKTDGST